MPLTTTPTEVCCDVGCFFHARWGELIAVDLSSPRTTRRPQSICAARSRMGRRFGTHGRCRLSRQVGRFCSAAAVAPCAHRDGPMYPFLRGIFNCHPMLPTALVGVGPAGTISNVFVTDQIKDHRPPHRHRPNTGAHRTASRAGSCERGRLGQLLGDFQGLPRPTTDPQDRAFLDSSPIPGSMSPEREDLSRKAGRLGCPMRVALTHLGPHSCRPAAESLPTMAAARPCASLADGNLRATLAAGRHSAKSAACMPGRPT